MFAYSELTRWRATCRMQFGDVFRLPVSTSPYSVCSSLYQSGKVLDIGAGTARSLRGYLGLSEEQYESVDTDPLGTFDYMGLDEVPLANRYELIVANQVLEHLTIVAAGSMLRQAKRLLADPGHLVLSVPNMQHPVRYWGDATHLTAWPFEDLYGLCRSCGLSVPAIWRSSKRRLSRNPLARLLVLTVCRQFRIDWCDTITLVCREGD